MKTFIEVAVDYLKTATIQEVLQMRTALDELEGKTSTVQVKDIMTQFKKEMEDYYINSGYQTLYTVKEIKTRTGWGLKEAKDYFDYNIRPINPEPRY